MRNSILALLWMIVAPVVAVAQDRPVVVELFTSQGCSSCPPADALMHELAKDPNVIALALHVDYWDYIGWKDSFADPAYTKRQRSYATVQSERMVYTPQMMVNGKTHVVGNRRGDVFELVKGQKAQPAVIDVTAAMANGQVRVDLTSASNQGPYVIHLVSYQPKSSVNIRHGENAGRTIEYANVVTRWRTIAEWSGRSGKSYSTNADAEPMVVLVQRKGFGEILGAAHVR